MVMNEMTNEGGVGRSVRWREGARQQARRWGVRGNNDEALIMSL